MGFGVFEFARLPVECILSALDGILPAFLKGSEDQTKGPRVFKVVGSFRRLEQVHMP